MTIALKKHKIISGYLLVWGTIVFSILYYLTIYFVGINRLPLSIIPVHPEYMSMYLFFSISCLLGYAFVGWFILSLLEIIYPILSMIFHFSLYWLFTKFNRVIVFLLFNFLFIFIKEKTAVDIGNITAIYLLTLGMFYLIKLNSTNKEIRQKALSNIIIPFITCRNSYSYFKNEVSYSIKASYIEWTKQRKRAKITTENDKIEGSVEQNLIDNLQVRTSKLQNNLKTVQHTLGINQLAVFQQLNNNFKEIIAQKLNIGELTYSRYSNAVKSVHLCILKALEQSYLALLSLSSMSHNKLQPYDVSLPDKKDNIDFQEMIY